MFRRYSYWKSSHLALIDSHKLGTHTGTHIRFLSDGKLHPRVLRPFPRLWGGEGERSEWEGWGKGEKIGGRGTHKKRRERKEWGMLNKNQYFFFFTFSKQPLQPAGKRTYTRFSQAKCWIGFAFLLKSYEILRKFHAKLSQALAGVEEEVKVKTILILLLFATLLYIIRFPWKILSC